MYNPPHFREERTEVLHQMMREHNFAAVITVGSEGLLATHIPLLLNPEPAPFGTLRGHVARANPQWRDSLPDIPALVLFQGPAAYITPGWYATKQEHGRVVPTYNYIIVHASGPLHIVDSPAQLHKWVRDLTDFHEADFPAPWQIDDAPEDFLQGQLKGIVGIEIPITRLEGKWKVSQNRSDADRTGVAAGLRAAGTPEQQAMTIETDARG